MSFSFMEITTAVNKTGVIFNGRLFNNKSASSRIWTKAKYDKCTVKKVNYDVYRTPRFLILMRSFMHSSTSSHHLL